MIHTHYQRLNLSRNCNDDEIESTYSILLEKCNSIIINNDEDKKRTERLLNNLETSYKILINPITRTEHDIWIDNLTKNTYDLKFIKDGLVSTNINATKIIHENIETVKNKLTSIDVNPEEILVEYKDGFNKKLKLFFNSYSQYFIRVLTENYVNFTGRSTRKEYWMFLLLTIVNFSILVILTIKILLLLYTLLITPPLVTITIRRLHDIGKSGWWIFVPIINFIFLFSSSEKKLNIYDIDELEKYALSLEKCKITSEDFNAKKNKIISPKIEAVDHS